jgi:CheY-like chemotaxis protein
MNLLWIDDDLEHNRFRFEEDLIKTNDWEVERATNVREALDKLSKMSFDAIFLDQSFPFEQVDKNTNVHKAKEQDRKAEEDFFAGRIVYSWLYQADEELDLATQDARTKLNQITEQYQPLAANQNIPILIMTSFNPQQYKHIQGKPLPVIFISPI